MAEIGCRCCSCCSISEEYLSPALARTELTITGNHPANLVAYIPYTQAYYSEPDQKYICDSIFPTNEDSKCCIGGKALIDRSESNDVWQGSFCCQFKASGSLNYERYFCCDEPPNVGWIKVGYGSYSSKVANSTTTTHAVWYRKLSVRFSSGREDDCCGVWVEVCLSFRRFLLSDGCSGIIATQSETNICPTSPVCGTSTCVPLSGSETCTYSCDEEFDPDSGGFAPCPPALDANDYIIEGEEPIDDSGLHYSILRRKFIPNEPSCSAMDVPLLSVVLGPEDNVETDFLGNNIGICDACPDNQELIPGFNQDFCVPDIVLYDRGTFSDACCPTAPVLGCGEDLITPGFAAIGGACWNRCDGASFLALSGGVPESLVECVSTGDGIDAYAPFHECYAYEGFPLTGQVWTVSDRVSNREDSCNIETCGHLLFGELQDQWQLTISL